MPLPSLYWNEISESRFYKKMSVLNLCELHPYATLTGGTWQHHLHIVEPLDGTYRQRLLGTLPRHAKDGPLACPRVQSPHKRGAYQGVYQSSIIYMRHSKRVYMRFSLWGRVPMRNRSRQSWEQTSPYVRDGITGAVSYHKCGMHHIPLSIIKNRTGCSGIKLIHLRCMAEVPLVIFKFLRRKVWWNIGVIRVRSLDTDMISSNQICQLLSREF